MVASSEVNGAQRIPYGNAELSSRSYTIAPAWVRLHNDFSASQRPNVPSEIIRASRMAKSLRAGRRGRPQGRATGPALLRRLVHGRMEVRPQPRHGGRPRDRATVARDVALGVPAGRLSR